MQAHTQQSLASVLHQSGIFYDHTTTTYKDSSHSEPDYIDLRLVISQPKIFNLCGKLLVQQVIELNKQASFDKIAGIANAGIPWATFISLQTNIPLLFIRKETKNYSLNKAVEGKYTKGDKVLLVDDMCAFGHAAITSALYAREAGLEVNHLVTIFQKATDQLIKKTLDPYHLTLHPLITYMDFINYLHQNDLITDQGYQIKRKFITSFRSAPHSLGNNND